MVQSLGSTDKKNELEEFGLCEAMENGQTQIHITRQAVGYLFYVQERSAYGGFWRWNG